MSAPQRPRVFLHIGAPKTGTTYLQDVLHRNRPALARAGLLYPGTQDAHFRASRDLRARYAGGRSDTHVPGAWDRLVREVRGWSGRSLISHETFAASPPRVVERALADLGFAEVHVVFTARDLARQLPAAWQERVKNGSSESFGSFLRSVAADADDRDATGRAFWAVQGAPTILARWARHLPAEQVHVVTVPPPGSAPGLLWQRFAGLLGLDPDAFDSTPQGVNTSLGAAEAAVLRGFNAEIAGLDLPWPVYAGVVKQRLAPALAQRRGAPIELPEQHFAWAVQRAQHIAEALRAAGYSVVGDLAELIPGARPAGLDPDDVGGDTRGDAALAGMAALMEFIAQTPAATAAVRRSQRGALARKVEEVVARTPALARIRDSYRGRR